MSGKDNRTLSLHNQVNGLFDLVGGEDVGFFWFISGQPHRFVHVAGEITLRNVFRYVDQNWARSAGCRNVIRFTSNAWQVVGVLYQVVVFNNGDRDAKDVGFLERVFSQHPSHLLATNNDHRNRVHHRRHKSRHCITSTRTRGN